MSSRWKTSQPKSRARKGATATTGGIDFDDGSRSDGLSFLDDMLGGGAASGGGGGVSGLALGNGNGGNNPSAFRQQSSGADTLVGHRGGRTGRGIDDILDLVGNKNKATSDASGTQKTEPASESAALRSDPMSKGSSNPKGQRTTSTGSGFGAMGSSKYCVDSKNSNRSSRTGSLRSRGGGSSGRKGSSGPLSPIPLSEPSGRSASPYLGMEQTRNKAPSSGNRPQPQATPAAPEPHPARFEKSGPEQFYGTIVNTARQEDDTISQITSSIASQSLYDSRAGDSYQLESSRNSGSKYSPWGTNGGGGGRGATTTMLNRSSSHDAVDTLHKHHSRAGGGHSGDFGDANSYADTLDQIADLIHPEGFRSGRGGAGGSGGSAGASRRQFTLGEVDADPLLTRRSPSSNDADRRVSRMGPGGQEPSLSNNQYNNSNRNNPSDVRSDPAANRYAGGSGRRPRDHPHHRPDSWYEPMLSQLRLQIRMLYSFIVPRSWRIRSKHDAKEEDYFGNLMRTNHPKATKRRHRALCGTLCQLFFFFCFLTALMLVLRLGMMHARDWRGPMSIHNHGRHKHRHKNQMQKDVDRSTLSGGIARGDERASTTGGVRGGMAHTTTSATGRIVAPMEDFQIGGSYKHDTHFDMEVPDDFDSFADVADLPVQKGLDVPYFWHIPRTGGGTVSDIFGGCLSLTLASDGGATEGTENALSVVTKNGQRFVNVDTSTPSGIERARQLDLASGGATDIVMSTLLYPSSTLFSPQNRGRMFAMFRHPVERAVSLFHFVQDTQWRRRQTFQKELSDLTIDEYFKTGLAENNWMTRFLTNEPTKSQLTQQDVNLAKQILRQKCLVGLLKEKGESFARFEKYFGFSLKNDREKECHEKKLQWAWPLKHRHDEVEDGSPLWELILSHNVWDMELYDYATVLFQEQAQLFK